MKYEQKLGKLFELFARDSADAKVASKKYGAQAGGESMNLGELMTTLKDARVLDDRCTAREVTAFFVMVNADDELYLPDPTAPASGKGAAELDYAEFEEIVCRICREKIPPLEDGDDSPMPFENTLDTWLGLVFIPALRNSGKGVLMDGGGKR